MSPEDLDRVELKTAIAGLRKQLKDAARQAEGLGPDDIRFRITGVELELTVVAEDSTTVGGEVGWWVFKGKADVGAKDAATQKVKLTLNVDDLKVSSGRETR
jgi:Trypsin-co-occurring domain 2